MQTKEKVICPHYGRVLLQRSLPKIHDQIQKLQQLFKKQAIKCECGVKLEIPNLCVKCHQPLCSMERQCLFDHHKNQGNDHCITINIHSTLIVCVLCKVEVLDFEQYGLTGNEEAFGQWINPQRLRIEYYRYFYKPEITNLKLGAQHVGILNVANCSFMTSVLQAVLNMPTVQLVLQKINMDQDRSKSKSPRKALLRQLCYISETFRLKSCKIINPTELIKAIAYLEPKLLGYARKEAYDFFKFLINFLHEEFKFTNLQKLPQQPDQATSAHDWDIISRRTEYKDYSFIQNMFSGELKSTLFCRHCKRETVQFESYSALSLEVPDLKTDGLLTKFFQGIKGTNKPHFTLKQCFQQFYEPVLDASLNCSCNSKEIGRVYQYKESSNYLCIHFQRFLVKDAKEASLISFPIEPTNFQEYFNLNGSYMYQLMSIVVHNRGGAGDHYEVILRQPDDTFISVKDEVVQAVPLKYVQECEAYMLFYKRLHDPAQNSMRHNIVSNKSFLEESLQSNQVKDEDIALIPNFWYEQFITLANPPKVLTSHLICIHGQLKPDYTDFRQVDTNAGGQNQSMDMNTTFLNQLSTITTTSIEPQKFFPGQFEEKAEGNNSDKGPSTPLISTQQSSSYLSLQANSTQFPKQICQFLMEKFGGGPIIPKTIRTCTLCIDTAQQMSFRRKMERQLIQKYENCSTIRNRIINEDWIKSWQSYLYNSKFSLQRNFIMGMKPPGEINNSALLDEKKQLIGTKKEGIHYRMITKPIWKVLHHLYGGGSRLARIGPELKNQESHEVFRLDSDDKILINELKDIAMKCQQSPV